MKLTGDAYAIVLSEWGQLVPDIGWYTGNQGKPAKKRSAIPCPYCHEDLREPAAIGVHRIVAITEKTPEIWRVIGQALPSTHRVLGCWTCMVHFTVPRKSAGRRA